MNILPEAIYNQHRKLQETLREHVNALVNGRVDPGEFVTFLKRELLPHARSEQRHLYPVVDTLVREHGRPTATMEVDHEFIADYARRIERLTDALILENQEEQAVPEALLRQLAVELEAVVQLHLAKEERIYLPLFEQYMPNGEQLTLLDKIRDGYMEEACMAKENILDVREAAPRETHPLGRSLPTISSKPNGPTNFHEATWSRGGALLATDPRCAIRRRHSQSPKPVWRKFWQWLKGAVMTPDCNHYDPCNWR